MTETTGQSPIKNKGQISQGIEILSTRIEECHVKLGELETSLNPVLSPATPSGAKDEGTSQNSKLGQEIDACVKRIEELLVDLEGLYMRLQL